MRQDTAARQETAARQAATVHETLAQQEHPTTGAATFAVAIACIDGRTHDPLVRWTRDRLGVDHVDLVTQPGVDVELSACPRRVCDGIRERLEVSLGAHAPTAVVVAGHDDCAANPVAPHEHRRQIAEAVAEVDGWQVGVPVLGVWIDRSGGVSLVAGGFVEGVGSDVGLSG